MHVGDLDRSSISLSATRWRARARIHVHDGDHVLLPGVVVAGRFGPNGATFTCTTGTSGACTLTRALKKTRTSIIFTVLALSKASYVYVSADNHDPDGESNGTRIVVTWP
jgi:hypothetical protein